MLYLFSSTENTATTESKRLAIDEPEATTPPIRSETVTYYNSCIRFYQRRNIGLVAMMLSLTLDPGCPLVQNLHEVLPVTEYWLGCSDVVLNLGPWLSISTKLA